MKTKNSPPTPSAPRRRSRFFRGDAGRPVNASKRDFRDPWGHSDRDDAFWIGFVRLVVFVAVFTTIVMLLTGR